MRKGVFLLFLAVCAGTSWEHEAALQQPPTGLGEARTAVVAEALCPGFSLPGVQIQIYFLHPLVVCNGAAVGQFGVR